MLLKIVGLFLSVLSIQAVTGQKRFCFNRRNEYKYYGTKTFYEDVKGNLTEAETPQGCEPVFIYMTVRHGARYPSRNVVPIFHELYDFARTLNTESTSTLCQTNLQAIIDWKVWTNVFNDQNQTDFGNREVRTVATNFQDKYPSLLSSANSPDFYKFTSTDTPRTRQSMRVFARAIYGLRVGNVAMPNLNVTPKPRDPLLRESCPRFLERVRNNPNANTQYNRFIQGKLMQRLSKNVAIRLGVPEENVPVSLVIKMYDACYYQRWVERRSGPWCFVFSHRDFEILDYATDLFNWAQRGFAFPISRQKNCFHSKEIINSLKLASDYDRQNLTYLKGRFRFGHVFNVFTTAANFDLYKVDEPPTASNFKSQQNRVFRTSQMIPSAGNLAFVLYKCTTNINQCPAMYSDYKVQILWNEKLVNNPACANDKDATTCGLDEMLKYYDQFVAGSVTECNQDQICSLD